MTSINGSDQPSDNSTMTNVFIFTYGCQMNKSDSEIMTGLLEHQGFHVQQDHPENADVLIFNSCAVRQHAENRVFSRIREFHGRRKKTGFPKLLILAGCIPQYQKDSLLKEHPYIDYIVGTNTFEYLPDILSGKLSGQQVFLTETKDLTATSTRHRESRNQAWIPIMFGCNNFCSYCIVPYTRGREVSREKDTILKEVADLKGTAYTQIMLLGQNVNSYGRGLYDHYGFADLLDDITAFDHIKKIDFLTSHPKDITQRLIEVIENHPSISRDIHFPLQAGDDDILRRMNRGYTYQEYKNKVNMIRQHIPNALISTDLIVGFPGETDKQFQNTLKAVQELAFYRINTAAFSIRKGTAAATFPDQISMGTKRHRLLKLQEYVKLYGFQSKNPVEKSSDV